MADAPGADMTTDTKLADVITIEDRLRNAELIGNWRGRAETKQEAEKILTELIGPIPWSNNATIVGALNQALERIRAIVIPVSLKLDHRHERDQLRAELKRCEEERDQFAEQAAMRDQRDADMQQLMGINNELMRESDQLRAELEKCREALKPFAKVLLWRDSDPFSGPDVLRHGTCRFTPDDVRRARALASRGDA